MALSEQQKINITLWNKRDRIIGLAERIRELAALIRDQARTEAIINYGYGERDLVASLAVEICAKIKLESQDIQAAAMDLYDEFAKALPEHLTRAASRIQGTGTPGKTNIKPG